jgi:hypothetical protein
MAKPLPPHPNVRNCTHIKVTGQRCGSPALRGEFFCYFHTRVIKGVQQRVDMRLDSMALLEDCESIQLSIMHIVDGLVKGTLELPRARLILQALRIAARNAKNVRFDDCLYRPTEQPMVRQVPDYARQYLIEHPEFGPPLSQCGAGAPAREADTKHQSPCSADSPVREADANLSTCGADTPVREADANPSTCGADTPVREATATTVAKRKAQAEPQAPQPNGSQESATAEPAAERRKHAAHGAGRGSTIENGPAPQERQKPERELQEEENEIKRVQAAIAGAERGNWRDLRTVFEFAGISEQNKDAPS